MDLNGVQIFAEVVKLGSFTSAARALGMTKTTVSRKIAELEAKTGAQLLFRTTRSLRLTEAGVIYYNKVSIILKDLENARYQLTSIHHKVEGNLNIVCHSEIGQLFLGPIFSSFLELYPDIAIHTELTNRKVDLIEERIDVLFNFGVIDDTHVQNFKLFNTSTTLMASPKYLNSFGYPKIPSELAKHSYIDCQLSPPRTGESGVISIFDGIQWVKFRPKVPFQVNNITLAREVAIAGGGIVALPEFLAEAALLKGQLLPLLEDFPLENNVLTMSFPKREFLPRKYVVFINFIYQTLFRNKLDELLEKPEFVELLE